MKRIVYLLLSIILVLGLVGCGTSLQDPEYNVTITDSEYFKPDIVEITNTGYIIRDTVIDGYSGTLMTPLYNADGTLKIYETAQ